MAIVKNRFGWTGFGLGIVVTVLAALALSVGETAAPALGQSEGEEEGIAHRAAALEAAVDALIEQNASLDARVADLEATVKDYKKYVRLQDQDGDGVIDRVWMKRLVVADSTIFIYELGKGTISEAEMGNGIIYNAEIGNGIVYNAEIGNGIIYNFEMGTGHIYNCLSATVHWLAVHDLCWF